MIVRFHGNRIRTGRLLSEFLVGLGLLFLTLGGNLAILHAATRAAEDAHHTRRAVELAEEAMEQVILNPQKYLKETRVNHFGSGVNDRFHSTTFERSILLTRLKGTEAGLARAQVWIEWEDGHKNFRLERYVRAD